MKGILLIAINSPFYGCMAYNMAVSIRLKSDMPITILADSQALSSLTSQQREIFSIVEPNLTDYLDKGISNPLKLKTLIYDYSPYQETLYLDVDGLWLDRNPEDLFGELNGFQIHEVDRYKKEDYGKCNMIWTITGKGAGKVQHLPEILKEKGITTQYPEYNSSFIYFEKSDKNKVYFDQVKVNYEDRYEKMKLGGLYPDELTWNLTSAQLKHYGKKMRPIYFQWENTVKEIHEIKKNFWILGMAAGYQPGKLISHYNSLARSNMIKHEGKFYRNFEFKMNKKLYFGNN
jgi:hypothetical protein